MNAAEQTSSPRGCTVEEVARRIGSPASFVRQVLDDELEQNGDEGRPA